MTLLAGLVEGIFLRLTDLFPGRCLLCDDLCPQPPDLCAPCANSLPWNTWACPRCGLPQTFGNQTCTGCVQTPSPLDSTVAPLRYAKIAKHWVNKSKHHTGLGATGGMVEARILGELLADAVTKRYPDNYRPDRIVPVPLSTRRLLQRGHNQAASIAQPVGQRLGIKVSTNILVRAQHRQAQQALSRYDRLTNLEGAFSCTQPVTGLSFAVVDDVMTTGATLGSIARLLRQQGATQVHAWVATRTPTT